MMAVGFFIVALVAGMAKERTVEETSQGGATVKMVTILNENDAFVGGDVRTSEDDHVWRSKS